MAESLEKATLIVGGHTFEDWESVWVQHIWGDPYLSFKFTAAERDPTAELMSLLQFKPGDECMIKLAGELVLKTGRILIRQAAFDKQSHGVILQGVSISWAAARASIIHKTCNFDKKSFKEIAEEVLKPTEVKARFDGEISDQKFERMQCKPGEPIFLFLDRIGRDRDIIVTSDKEGDLLFVGKRKPDNQGEVVEGKNILKCQAIISDKDQRSFLVAHAQSPGNDKNKMRPPAEQEAKADGTLKYYSPLLIPVEQPTWTNKELEQRVNTEARWTAAQQIQVTVVLQGWRVSGGGSVWQAGKNVNFKSKMAMINQELSIQSVTFTQDDKNGSLTTLLLVAPWGLNAQRGFLPSTSQQPPTPAKADSTPPKTGQK